MVYASMVTVAASTAIPARVPPRNDEAEEAVLGAMLISPSAIASVVDVVNSSDFYKGSHGKIYRAALELFAKGEPVDAITLVDFLEERGELEDVGQDVADDDN